MKTNQKNIYLNNPVTYLYWKNKKRKIKTKVYNNIHQIYQ